MPTPERGDVWLADLGMVAKIRPCLVLSVRPDVHDRALIALVPHTTSVRGTHFEVTVPKPFLTIGVFDVQGLITVAPPRLIRKLGELQATEISLIEQWLRDGLVSKPVDCF